MLTHAYPLTDLEVELGCSPPTCCYFVGDVTLKLLGLLALQQEEIPSPMPHHAPAAVPARFFPDMSTSESTWMVVHEMGL